MKYLQEGQHVTLRTGTQELLSRVERIGESHVLLGLARSPEPPLTPGTAATLEVADHRGLHRLTGVVNPDPDYSDVVNLRFEGPMENIQRREHVRVDAHAPVAVMRFGHPPIDTYTENVSGSGLLLAGPEDLEVGEEVQLRIKLAEDDDPLDLHATVVRETEAGHKGVHITGIEERDRDRLIHFVFERQRNIRKVKA
jgi:hypothetical protein